MDVEGTVGTPGSCSWAGDQSLNIGKPGEVKGQTRPCHPDSVQTPRDALSYIELLYKSGRMEDLAGLLRQNQVFREAWLMIQRSSPSGWRPGGEVAGSSNRGPTQGAAQVPAPSSGVPGWKVGTPTASQGLQTTAPSSSTAEPNSGTGATSFAAGRSRRSLAMGLKAYQSQENRYTREKTPGPQLSLRV